MNISELAGAFERVRSLSFPCDSVCEETGELHAELALYDTTMAGIITTLIKTGRVSPAYVILLKPDSDLRTRLQAAMKSHCSIVALDALRYLEYLDALEEAVQLAARELLPGTG